MSLASSPIDRVAERKANSVMTMRPWRRTMGIGDSEAAAPSGLTERADTSAFRSGKWPIIPSGEIRIRVDDSRSTIESTFGVLFRSTGNSYGASSSGQF